MIKTFEEYTYELDTKEKDMLPHVIEVLKVHVGKGEAIKNPILSEQAMVLHYGTHQKQIKKLAPERIRKVIHYIRERNLLPLVCSSQRGYWLAETKEEVENCIISLKQRIKSINDIRSSLQKQYDFAYKSQGEQGKLF